MRPGMLILTVCMLGACSPNEAFDYKASQQRLTAARTLPGVRIWLDCIEENGPLWSMWYEGDVPPAIAERKKNATLVQNFVMLLDQCRPFMGGSDWAGLSDEQKSYLLGDAYQTFELIEIKLQTDQALVTAPSH